MKTLLELTRSETNKIIVSVDEYNGRKFLSLREWFKPEDKPEWLPTKKGLTIRTGELDRFIQAINAAKKELAGGETS